MAPEAGRPEGGSEIVRREVIVVWIMSSVIHPSIVSHNVMGGKTRSRREAGRTKDMLQNDTFTLLFRSITPLRLLIDIYTLTHFPIPVSEA